MKNFNENEKNFNENEKFFNENELKKLKMYHFPYCNSLLTM
jgi:hypothetical protein